MAKKKARMTKKLTVEIVLPPKGRPQPPSFYLVGLCQNSTNRTRVVGTLIHQKKPLTPVMPIVRKVGGGGFHLGPFSLVNGDPIPAGDYEAHVVAGDPQTLQIARTTHRVRVTRRSSAMDGPVTIVLPTQPVNPSFAALGDALSASTIQAQVQGTVSSDWEEGAVNGGGQWCVSGFTQAGTSTPLPNGSYSLVARDKDNPSDSDSISLVINSTAPGLACPPPGPPP